MINKPSPLFHMYKPSRKCCNFATLLQQHNKNFFCNCTFTGKFYVKLNECIELILKYVFTKNHSLTAFYSVCLSYQSYSNDRSHAFSCALATIIALHTSLTAKCHRKAIKMIPRARICSYYLHRHDLLA